MGATVHTVNQSATVYVEDSDHPDHVENADELIEAFSLGLQAEAERLALLLSEPGFTIVV